MIAINKTFHQVSQEFLTEFFRKCPNSYLQNRANRTLKKLIAAKIPMPGKHGGWAGGIVYSISSIGVGVPAVLNSELQE